MVALMPFRSHTHPETDRVAGPAVEVGHVGMAQFDVVDVEPAEETGPFAHHRRTVEPSEPVRKGTLCFRDKDWPGDVEPSLLVEWLPLGTVVEDCSIGWQWATEDDPSDESQAKTKTVHPHSPYWLLARVPIERISLAFELRSSVFRPIPIRIFGTAGKGKNDHRSAVWQLAFGIAVE